MSDEKTFLAMMIDALEQKIEALKGIIAQNEKQKATLEDPNGTPDEFERTIARKQVYIDRLTELDDGFEAVFAKIRPAIEADRQAYKAEIQKMQGLITTITELSAKVEVQEKHNYTLATNKFADVKRRVQKVRKSQHAVNQYYTNMMKINNIDPQFMDGTT